MACGDKFRHLAVTSSGLSFENPFDDIATSGDYEEWIELARRMLLLSQAQLDALEMVEGAATPGTWTHWNAANSFRERAVQQFDDLPSTWVAFNISQAIGEAQASILDSLCAMELANDSIVELGSVPPPTPGAPDPHDNDGLLSGAENAAGIAIGLAVVAGIGFALLTRKRR